MAFFGGALLVRIYAQRDFPFFPQLPRKFKWAVSLLVSLTVPLSMYLVILASASSGLQSFFFAFIGGVLFAIFGVAINWLFTTIRSETRSVYGSTP